MTTKTKPRAYQREDVLAIEKKFRGRCLLAHSPGLGKSPITLWWIRDHMGPGNVVIVVQANLKVNWARESVKHIGRKVVILEGRTPTKFPFPPPKDQIFVINYDILGRPGPENATWLNWLKRLKPKCVVLDEIQAVKSRDTIRTKACRELCRRVPHVLGLGGTGALENCPADLFPVLNMIRPDKWNSFFTYATDHCEPKKTHWGWEFKGATRLKKLHHRLKKYCFPAQTLVHCKEGLRTIGEIVRSQIRTEVLCYDEVSAEVLWRPILAFSRTASPSVLVRVEHETGEFICTPDHQVRVQERYVAAQDLIPGLLLSTVRGEDQEKKSCDVQVLLDPMRGQGQSSGRTSHTQDGPNTVGVRQHGEQQTGEVPALQKGIRQETQIEQVLLDQVRGDSQGEETRTQNRVVRNGQDSVRVVRKDSHQVGSHREHEVQEAVLFREVRKTSGVEQNTKIGESESGLSNLETSEEAARQTESEREQLETRVPRERQQDHGAVPTRSDLLSHVGPRPSEAETRGGSRWERAPICEAAEVGSSEGIATQTSRVVRTAVLQRGDRHWPFPRGEEGEVYDIEVAEHHNFFANGVLVHNCMIRRRKEDVLKDLPPVNRIVVPVALSAALMGEYRKAETDFVRWLKSKWVGATVKGGKMSSHRLAQMTHLKKLAEESKTEFFREWLAGWLADNPRKKVLFFGWHTKFLTDMHKAFPGSVLITGKTRQKDRQAMTDKFNGDPSCRVFFGNLLAAGAGWSCTSSSTCVLGGFAWNPSLMKQAGGRNHGIGRGVKGEGNTEYWFPAVGTVEERLLKVLESKQGIQDEILDGAEEGSSTLDVFNQLTESYTGGKA